MNLPFAPDSAGRSSASELHMIGAWTFDPVLGLLTRGAERRKIEFRAAATLALLCRQRGEVVSHGHILAEVWGGRCVSPNSVAVVIGDIRRALGEDARKPAHVETVAKRGYRLAPDDRAGAPPAPSPAPAPTRFGRRLLAWIGAAAMAALAVTFLLARPSAPPVEIAIGPVVNATGDARYDPAARALTELTESKLAGRAGLKAVETVGPRGGGALLLSSKLILWDGHPTLSMKLVAPDGAVRWSGMAAGPPFYASVSGRLDDLASSLGTGSGRAP